MFLLILRIYLLFCPKLNQERQKYGKLSSASESKGALGQVKHLVSYQREVDNGKLTAVANLEKLMFRA